MIIRTYKGLQGKIIAEFDEWYGVEVSNQEFLETVVAKANEILEVNKALGNRNGYLQALKYVLDQLGVDPPYSTMIMRTAHDGKFEVWEEVYDDYEDPD